MQLLASWKHSLQLLTIKNFKQFLHAIVAVVPRIYGSWIIYGCLSLSLIFSCILLIEKFGYVPYSEQLFVVSVSLLVGYAAMTLYILVKEGLNNQAISLKKYKQQMIGGVLVLALVAGALLFFSAIYSLWEIRFEGYHKAILEGKQLPALVYEHMQIRPQAIAVIFSMLLLFIQGVMLHSSLVMFFFLDTAGSIVDLLKSVLKAIRFILFNLPVLIIVYAFLIAVLFILHFIVSQYLLNLDELSSMYFLTARLLFDVIFLVPLFVIINGQLYKQYK